MKRWIIPVTITTSVTVYANTLDEAIGLAEGGAWTKYATDNPTIEIDDMGRDAIREDLNNGQEDE